MGVEEVIFYCKAGVRSRAAAQMAREWKGVRVGEMRGGGWSGRGEGGRWRGEGGGDVLFFVKGKGG